MSLLSAKTRRLNPEAQVASLVRIGRRAAAKADWLRQLSAESPYATFLKHDELAADAAALDEKVRAAAAELCEIVLNNPQAHWSLPQRRAAEAYQKASAS